MAAKKRNDLTEAQKAFLVQHLACYDSPSEVAAAFKAEYGIEISPQRAESYDPTKQAGKKLSDKWREVFEATRKSFLSDIESYIPEANKAVRVRQLAQSARALKARGNHIAAADMLERISKELGNVYTNRRELTGKDGGPVQYAEMSAEQVDQHLARMLGQSGVEDEADERVGSTH